MPTLNTNIATKLINQFSYTPNDIREIETSATLVKLLNNFTGQFIYDKNYNGAFFNPNGNKIVLGNGYTDKVTLAHELGHATGSYQATYPNDSQQIFFDKYSTAREYADERERGEGEAIYYQFKVGREINPSHGV